MTHIETAKKKKILNRRADNADNATMSSYIHVRDENVFIGPFDSDENAETYRQQGILWIGTEVVSEIPTDAEIIPPQ